MLSAFGAGISRFHAAFEASPETIAASIIEVSDRFKTYHHLAVCQDVSPNRRAAKESPRLETKPPCGHNRLSRGMLRSRERRLRRRVRPGGAPAARSVLARSPGACAGPRPRRAAPC